MIALDRPADRPSSTDRCPTGPPERTATSPPAVWAAGKERGPPVVEVDVVGEPLVMIAGGPSPDRIARPSSHLGNRRLLRVVWSSVLASVGRPAHGHPRQSPSPCHAGGLPEGWAMTRVSGSGLPNLTFKPTACGSPGRNRRYR